jgi:Protein of unknown function (Hypoth_ymh)
MACGARSACPVGLPVVTGVVALPGEDGQELCAGAEVGAGFAGGLHAAVWLGRPGAQPVAEHPGVRFAEQPGHAGRLVVGGQCGQLPVESVDLGARCGVFRGAYAVLRNPSGHREVSVDDATEASEAVVTASLLMRMLDKIDHRIEFAALLPP